MPATQDFLNNVKIYIDRIDGNSLWLIDFKNEIATTWGLTSFVQQDFDVISTPTKARYEDFLELLKREETPLFSSWMRMAPTPVTLSSGEITQRLSIATPILASLVQAEWYANRILPSGNTTPTPRDTLVAIALELTDTLLTEVQK